MKPIQPIQLWVNGQNKTATVLGAKITNDDLSTSCKFTWQLYLEESVNPQVPTGQSYISLAQGTVDMMGEDYQNWDGFNDTAYAFIAEKINVTIVE